MNTNAPHILEAALDLPDDDRAAIAFQLLGTLKPPGIKDANDPLLKSEIERRLAAYNSGESEASRIDEVDVRIRAALAAKKSS